LELLNSIKSNSSAFSFILLDYSIVIFEIIFFFLEKQTLMS